MNLPIRFYTSAVVLLFFFVLLGCGGGVKNKYTDQFVLRCSEAEQPTPGLVVAESTDEYSCHDLGDMKKLLDKAAQKVEEENRESLIFFVHGRGAHPGKLADKKLINNLEKENNAVVIAFHWPSYEGLTGYADESAKNSAPLLIGVLKQMEEWQKSHTGDLKNVMLVHSMGNIVVEEMVRSQQMELDSIGVLFDTLVLNSADVPFASHAEWLVRLNLAPDQYVTINEHDPTLKQSKRYFNGTNRLGNCLYGDEPLAGNVVYVDFSQTKANHRYYVEHTKSNDSRQTFYGKVLRGIPLDYSQLDDIQIIRDESPVILELSGIGGEKKPDC